MRAGFLFAGQRQHDIGGLGERRGLAGRDRDQRDLEAAGIGDDPLQFGAFAAPGHRNDHVIAGNHPEITVIGFNRMNEKRRRAGRGKGGGQFRTDMATLADAGDNHPAGNPEYGINGVGKRLRQRTCQRPFQRGKAVSLGFNGAERRSDGLCGFWNAVRSGHGKTVSAFRGRCPTRRNRYPQGLLRFFTLRRPRAALIGKAWASGAAATDSLIWVASPRQI